METVHRKVDERLIGRYQGRSVAQPVAWSAVWIGTLAAPAVALMIGLIGMALGAHALIPPRRVVQVRDVGFGAALGAGSYFGTWYGGLAGTPTQVTPPSGPVDLDGAIAARNSALGPITAFS